MSGTENRATGVSRDLLRQPLVSIVIPTYNQAEYLEEAIESVLRQKYPNIEIIVLNDGSTDETEGLLTKYQDVPGVDWETQSNMGQARTLNKGWLRSKGEYLGYLSSDDVLYEGCIEKLVNVLEGDKSCVCAYPDSCLIDKSSRVIKENVCREFSLEELVVRQECYIGPGALFRRDAFAVVGGWNGDLKLAPDREFWMRLAMRGTFIFHKETLAGYRLHKASISYKSVSERESREYLDVLNSYFCGEHVPESVVNRRDEAYGYANFLIARNCFRSGSYRTGMRYYREACAFHPPLCGMRTKAILLRTIVSKPIRGIVATVVDVICGKKKGR